jgi:5-methylcytosine-specific restriction endonuclease McrA
MEEYKTCHWCGKRKVLEDYHRRTSAKDGRQKYCKTCRGAISTELAKTPVAKAKRSEYAKTYLNRNREKSRERVRSRRARKITNSLVVSVKEAKRIYSSQCFYCGNSGGEMDHVLPLSRGGLHSVGNLVPACRSCNASKGAKTIMEWRLWRRRLDSDA